MNQINKREGFWKSTEEPDLPQPIPNDTPWEGEAEFLEELYELQSCPRCRSERYRDSSRCRLCGCINGSDSYFCDGWEWPSGFAHYVLKHHVRPSPEFMNFVLGEK